MNRPPPKKGRNLQEKGGRDSAAQILRILKVNEIQRGKRFTEEDEDYIQKVNRLLEEGGLPKQTAKTVLKSLDQELKNGINPLRIIALLRTNIAPEFFRETMAETAAQTAGPERSSYPNFLFHLNDPSRWKLMDKPAAGKLIRDTFQNPFRPGPLFLFH